MPEPRRVVQFIGVPEREDGGVDTFALCRFGEDVDSVIVELYEIGKEMVIPRIVGFYVL